MIVKNVIKKLVYKLTLRPRILLIFISGLLATNLYIVAISSYAIDTIQIDKFQASIQNNLNQTARDIDNTMDNLNRVSQQLAFQGSVGMDLDQFLIETAPYRKRELLEKIQQQLNLITFTNPNIGLTLYYFSNDDSYIMENYMVSQAFDIDTLPKLASYNKITYYGPHKSNERFKERSDVLSILRLLELPECDDVFIYIETPFKIAQNASDNASFFFT